MKKPDAIIIKELKTTNQQLERRVEALLSVIEILKIKDYMKTFEQYLEDICFEENPTILDDDMPGFFEGWLQSLDTDDLFIYAEGWGRHIKSYILREVTKLTK